MILNNIKWDIYQSNLSILCKLYEKIVIICGSNENPIKASRIKK